MDELVISLSAKGLTAGEVQAHLAEVYGAEVATHQLAEAVRQHVLTQPVGELPAWAISQKPPPEWGEGPGGSRRVR